MTTRTTGLWTPATDQYALQLQIILDNPVRTMNTISKIFVHQSNIFFTAKVTIYSLDLLKFFLCKFDHSLRRYRRKQNELFLMKHPVL